MLEFVVERCRKRTHIRSQTQSNAVRSSIIFVFFEDLKSKLVVFQFLPFAIGLRRKSSSKSFAAPLPTNVRVQTFSTTCDDFQSEMSSKELCYGGN